MSFWSSLFGTSDPPVSVAPPQPLNPAPAADPRAPLDGLAAALSAAAPNANRAVWLTPLTVAMRQQGLTTHRRIAAALGQFAVEAGEGFGQLAENLNYTHADRIMTVFGSHFSNLSAAQECCGNPEKLANRVYANRMGNGDEASGDGWRFRGRGLIQLTGRDEYTAFAAAVGMTPEAASDYLETPAGAAASGCWYFVWRNTLAMMDAWNLNGITFRVNGSAMEGHDERIAASEAALKALGGA